jgi:hypothetical protein
VNILVSILNGIGGIARSLGFGGCVTVVVGLLILALFLKFVDLADRTLDRAVKWWRRLPMWGKQIVVVFVTYLAWRQLWPMLPKTTGMVAVGLGLAVTWWLQGLRYARRYGLEDTTATQAWLHHRDTTRLQRGLTKAVGNATGKPNGRARKPTMTPTGVETVIEPPDGMSPADFADLANSGGLHPSTARQVGWDAVKGMAAEPQSDGTVRLYVDSERSDGADPLAESRRWPGMERP